MEPNSDWVPAKEEETPVPGKVESAAEAEIEEWGKSESSLAVVALKLARALDQLHDDVEAPVLTKLAQEFRTTLMVLKGVKNDGGVDRIGELFRELSSPLRNAEDAGEIDLGSVRGAGGAAAR